MNHFPRALPMRRSWLLQVSNSAQTFVGAAVLREPRLLRQTALCFSHNNHKPQSPLEKRLLRGLLSDLLRLLSGILDQVSPGAAQTSVSRIASPEDPEWLIRTFQAVTTELVAALENGMALPAQYRARLWIEKHYAADVPVRELAARFSVHPKTLNRCFRRQYGTTPQEFRRQCRAARASDLLVASELKIEAVAAAVGLKSKSTLYRLLHRYGGTLRRDLPRRSS